MTEQMLELRSFSYLSLLVSSSKEKIYRLLYDNTVRYFQIRNTGTKIDCQLFHTDGSILSGDRLQPLYEKIQVYERLFGKSIEQESLEGWLRIDEVTFLLGELSMNRPNLEGRIYDRLMQHVVRQSRKPFYDPLLLPKILAHNDFVYNYLQTNIGHPDGTENYFNRMKIMIQQIGEQTAYAEVHSYFSIIRSLLLYLTYNQINDRTVIIKGKDCYCLIRGGMQSIPVGDHAFTGSKIPPDLAAKSKILEADNSMITELIKIYNSLEFE